MATVLQFVVICLGFFCKLSSAVESTKSSFEDVFEDVTSCSASCERTYPLHTYPQNENLRACQRGCRLFSMLEFAEVDYEDTDFNATKEACKGACHEAYVYPDELYACTLGCSEQLPFSVKRKQEYMNLGPSMHLLQPIFTVRSIWEQLTSHTGGYSLSSWMFYMRSDNGRVYIFESQPEIDIFTVDPDPQENLNFGRPFSGFETNLEVLNDHDPTSDPNYLHMNSLDTSNWLDCVAKRSGLPGWLLSVTILLSSVALLWLCCATMVTAPERRVVAPKLSINGDLEYLKKSKKNPHPVYITMYTANKSATKVPLDDDDDEPLPLDIDIIPIQSKI